MESERDFERVIDKIKNDNALELERPEYWINNTKHGFSEWVYENFKINTDAEKNNLLFHQRLIRKYLQPDSLFRGLLLYHGLGTGKTRSAISVSEALIRSNSKEKCIVLLPASLKSNFMDEIKKMNSLYRAEGNWKFFKLGDTTHIGKLKNIIEASTLNLLVKKQGGIWLPTNSKDREISGEEKKQVEGQIESMISKRYEFVHYNGLNRKLLTELPNFNNKVIIIDEVHNLTSGLHKSTNTVKYALYQQLFKSDNSTFVLLSGTPIINEPVEIAYAVNLLRGRQTVHSITLSGMPRDMNLIDSFKYIDMLTIKTNSKKEIVFSFTLLPKNYFKKADGKIHQMNNNYAYSEVTLLGMIKEKLGSLEDMNGDLIKVTGKVKTNDNYALPVDKKDFDELFVNAQSNTLALPNIFKRRIMGSISSYQKSKSDLDKRYPVEMKPKFYNVPMSSYQLKIYNKERDKEIKKENNAARFHNSETNGVYKIFSRAICNFVFPKDVLAERFPSNRSLFLAELDKSSAEYIDDDSNNDEEQSRKEQKKKYQEAISGALTKLKEKGEQYLSIGAGLKQLSPKFDLILKNIITNENKGTHILYSDFRKVEGLRIIGLCLQANGIGEMKVSKENDKYRLVYSKPGLKAYFAKFGEDSSKNSDAILLRIFNNDIDNLPKSIKDQLKDESEGNLRGKLLKLLMITRSGAEGISLRNVRHVHIVEPYWNNIRIDQVIGRANRLDSHKDLEETERNFTVHHYCSTFDEDDINEGRLTESIRTKDKSLTSDQLIRNIAERKEKLIQEFLQGMKQASIDCKIHDSDKNCLKPPDDADADDNAFTFQINDESISIRSSRIQLNNNTGDATGTLIVQFTKNVPKSILKKKFIYNPETHSLYDYTMFTTPRTRGSKRFVGTMKKVNKDKYFISINK